MLPEITATYTKAAFQPFYTDAQHIRELMLDLLGDVEGMTVLEPCAGQGAFLKGLQGTPVQVDAVDKLVLRNFSIHVTVLVRHRL